MSQGADPAPTGEQPDPAPIFHPDRRARSPNERTRSTDLSGEFEKQLEVLIGRYSKEGLNNTPDYILAKYLNACLHAYSNALAAREAWYGRSFIPAKLK